MDMLVIEVTDFKSEVRFNLRGCLETEVASKAVKKGPNHKGSMHMDIQVMATSIRCRIGTLDAEPNSARFPRDTREQKTYQILRLIG